MSIQKYAAEGLGTAVLVFIGCGSVVIGGYGENFPAAILPIALAFGLAITAMAYAIGPVSGCHINPAITLAVWLAGRMKAREVPFYIISQCLGAIAGTALLILILSGKLKGYDIIGAGLAQNGWGPDYLGGYDIKAAILTEFIATFILAFVVLGATGKGATPVAGLAIGSTVAILILAFINVTGVSLNPARSLGPAIFVGGTALAQLWLFLLVPSIAGALAGLLYKVKFLG